MSRPGIHLGLYPTRPAGESARLAARAEALGLEAVWVIDSPVIWRELWVTLTAAGAATSRIRVGSGVTTGLTRHPAVTASAALTLDELTGGRFVLGLGSGDSSLVTTGLGSQRLADFRLTVESFRALLAGEEGRIGATPIRLPWAKPRGRVPIYVAASGPRMLELAGAMADGVIMMVGVSPAIVGAALEQVRAGARAVGRRPEEVDTVVWTACAMSDREPARAREVVKANVARAVMRMLPHPIAPRYAEVVARIRQAYDYQLHTSALAPHGDLVPDALVDDFAVAGTAADCVSSLRRMATLGVGAVALALPDAPFEDRETMLARLATDVLPAL